MQSNSFVQGMRSLENKYITLANYYKEKAGQDEKSAVVQVQQIRDNLQSLNSAREKKLISELLAEKQHLED